ncbi:AAA family ATPase, partial [Candidatus Omnitrophota bacterium]
MDKVLKIPWRLLREAFPLLARSFDQIQRRAFANFSHQQAAGILELAGEVSFLLEDRYAELPEGVTHQARDLLVFLHLIHELVEFNLSETPSKSLITDFNIELVAFIAQSLAYNSLPDTEKEEIKKAAAILDGQEAIEDRFSPVLEFFDRHPVNDKVILDKLDLSVAVNDFLDQYPGLDKNDYNQELVVTYLKRVRELSDIKKPSTDEAEPTAERFVDLSKFDAVRQLMFEGIAEKGVAGFVAFLEMFEKELKATRQTDEDMTIAALEEIAEQIHEPNKELQVGDFVIAVDPESQMIQDIGWLIRAPSDSPPNYHYWDIDAEHHLHEGMSIYRHQIDLETFEVYRFATARELLKKRIEAATTDRDRLKEAVSFLEGRMWHLVRGVTGHSTYNLSVSVRMYHSQADYYTYLGQINTQGNLLAKQIRNKAEALIEPHPLPAPEERKKTLSLELVTYDEADPAKVLEAFIYQVKLVYGQLVGQLIGQAISSLVDSDAQILNELLAELQRVREGMDKKIQEAFTITEGTLHRPAYGSAGYYRLTRQQAELVHLPSGSPELERKDLHITMVEQTVPYDITKDDNPFYIQKVYYIFVEEGLSPDEILEGLIEDRNVPPGVKDKLKSLKVSIERGDTHTQGDRLGARPTPLPGPAVQPIPKGPIPGEVLAGPRDRLERFTPSLIEQYDKLTRFAFADFMGQHGAAGLEQKGEEITFLLEDRYQDENLPEGVTRQARDLLIFLHLVHELTEWKLTELTETIRPDFNRELAAMVAQLVVYHDIGLHNREQIREAARLLDEQEQGFDDRYGPVIEFFERVIHGEAKPIFDEEDREELISFIDRYHDFDKGDYDDALVTEHLAKVRTLLGLDEKPSVEPQAIVLGRPVRVLPYTPEELYEQFESVEYSKLKNVVKSRAERKPLCWIQMELHYLEPRTWGEVLVSYDGDEIRSIDIEWDGINELGEPLGQEQISLTGNNSLSPPITLGLQQVEDRLKLVVVVRDDALEDYKTYLKGSLSGELGIAWEVISESQAVERYAALKDVFKFEEVAESASLRQQFLEAIVGGDIDRAREIIRMHLSDRSVDELQDLIQVEPIVSEDDIRIGDLWIERQPSRRSSRSSSVVEVWEIVGKGEHTWSQRSYFLNERGPSSSEGIYPSSGGIWSMRLATREEIEAMLQRLEEEKAARIASTGATSVHDPLTKASSSSQPPFVKDEHEYGHTVSQDASLQATARSDGSVVVFNPDSMQAVRVFDPERSHVKDWPFVLGFTPDGRYLAVAAVRGREGIFLYDLQTGKELKVGRDDDEIQEILDALGIDSLENVFDPKSSRPSNVDWLRNRLWDLTTRSHRFAKKIKGKESRPVFEKHLRDIGITDRAALEEIFEGGVFWFEKATHRFGEKSDEVLTAMALALSELLEREVKVDDLRRVIGAHEEIHAQLVETAVVRIRDQLKDALGKTLYQELLKSFQRQYGKYPDELELIEELIAQAHLERLLGNPMRVLDDSDEVVPIDNRAADIIRRAGIESIVELMIPYYEAKTRLVEAAGEGEFEAYRQAFKDMESQAKRVASQNISRALLAVGLAVIFEEEDIPKDLLGEGQEIIHASGPEFRDEHIQIVREMAREVATSLTRGRAAEELERSLIARTREMRLADHIPPDLETEPTEPKELSKRLNMLALADSFSFWAQTRLSYELDKQTEIQVRPLEDLVAYRVAYLHEIIHDFQQQGLLPILPQHELITHAATALELVRAQGQDGLRDFGGEFFSRLFEFGQELFREDASVEDLRWLYENTQEKARALADELRTTPPEEGPKESPEPLTKQEKAEQFVEFERLVGTVLGGVAWEREEQTAKGGLAYIFQYAVDIVGRSEMQVNALMASPESQRRAERLRAVMLDVAKTLTADRQLQLLDWEEWQGSEIPEVRYLPDLHRLVVPRQVWYLDQTVAQGIVAQEIFRALHAKPELIEEELQKNDTFVALWYAADTPRVVERGSSRLLGARDWVDRFYDFKHTIPNLLIDQQQMADLPLHLQYFAGILWMWQHPQTDTGDETIELDPRITDKRVLDALRETQESLHESFTADAERHAEILHKILWPTVQALREQAIEDAMFQKAMEEMVQDGSLTLDQDQQEKARQGQLRPSDLTDEQQEQVQEHLDNLQHDELKTQEQQATESIDQQVQPFQKQYGSQGLDGMVILVVIDQSQSQPPGGDRTQDSDQLFGQQGQAPPSQEGPSQPAQPGQPGQAGQPGQPGEQVTFTDLASAMETLVQEAEALEQLAGQAEETAQRLRDSAGAFHSEEATRELVETLHEFAQKLHQEAAKLRQQAQSFHENTTQAKDMAGQENQAPQQASNLAEEAGQFARESGRLEKRTGDLARQTDTLKERAEEQPDTITPALTDAVVNNTETLKEETSALHDKAKGLEQLTQAVAEAIQQAGEQAGKEEGEGEGDGAGKPGEGQADGTGKPGEGQGQGASGQPAQSTPSPGQADQRGRQPLQPLDFSPRQEPGAQQGESSGGKGYGTGVTDAAEDSDARPPEVRPTKPGIPSLPSRELTQTGTPVSEEERRAADTTLRQLPKASPRTPRAKETKKPSIPGRARTYRRLKRSLSAQISRLKRDIKAAFRQTTMGGTLTGLPEGDYLDDQMLAQIKGRPPGVMAIDILPGEFDYCVSLLIDVSGSMLEDEDEYDTDNIKKSKLYAASEAAALLRESTNIEGVDVEEYAFSTKPDVRLRDYGERLTEKRAAGIHAKIFSTEHRSTADVSALSLAIDRMRNRRRGQKPGLRVYGIGIGGATEEVKDAYAPYGYHIPHVNQLRDLIRQILEKEIKGKSDVGNIIILITDGNPGADNAAAIQRLISDNRDRWAKPSSMSVFNAVLAGSLWGGVLACLVDPIVGIVFGATVYGLQMGLQIIAGIQAARGDELPEGFWKWLLKGGVVADHYQGIRKPFTNIFGFMTAGWVQSHEAVERGVDDFLGLTKIPVIGPIFNHLIASVSDPVTLVSTISIRGLHRLRFYLLRGGKTAHAVYRNLTALERSGRKWLGRHRILSLARLSLIGGFSIFMILSGALESSMLPAESSMVPVILGGMVLGPKGQEEAEISDLPLHYEIRPADGGEAEFLVIGDQAIQVGQFDNLPSDKKDEVLALIPDVEILHVNDLALPLPADGDDDFPATYVARVRIQEGSGTKQILIPLSPYNMNRLTEMAAILSSSEKPNLYLRGPAAAGKNTLLYLLAGLAKQSPYLMSLNYDSTRRHLVALQTYKETGEEETAYRASPVVQAADLGAWGVADEINKPKQQGVIAAWHSLLDDSRYIALPDARVIVAKPNFRFIALGNPDREPYIVQELPEDSKRRFQFVDFDYLHAPKRAREEDKDVEARLHELKFLLRLQAPELYAQEEVYRYTNRSGRGETVVSGKDFFDNLIHIGQDIVEAFEDGTLPRAITIRGLMRIIRYLEYYPEDTQDFMNVVGGAYNLTRLDSHQREVLETLIEARLPGLTERASQAQRLEARTITKKSARLKEL